MDVGDERGVRDEAELARGLGFGGKMCIHPRQVEIVESVWIPSHAEIEWAQRVLAAHDEAIATGRGIGHLQAAVDRSSRGRASARNPGGEPKGGWMSNVTQPAPELWGALLRG